MSDATIHQLTDAEIDMITELARPFGADGSVTLRRDLVVSMINEIAYHRAARGEDLLNVSSVVSMRDGRPLVRIQFGSRSIQITPEEATAFATNLMNGASAALADAFLTGFVAQCIKGTPEDAARLLSEFRVYRDQRPDPPPATRADGET